MAPNIWQQYTDSSGEPNRSIPNSNEASDKIREWFRENAHLAADQLTGDVRNILRGNESKTNDGFDIRLTVLARAGEEIGIGPLESGKTAANLASSHPSSYFHLYSIAEIMPPRDPKKQVSVVLRKDVINRGTNVEVKDANFVRKRQILLDCQGKSEETIMAESGNVSFIDTEGSAKKTNYLPNSWKSTIITEGSCSNFFAVYRVPECENSFVLRTAGNDRVLGGTVRELLLEKYSKTFNDENASKRFRISVSSIPPTVDEIQDWVGCFITSTSRLVLPISEVILPVYSGSIKSIEKLIECRNDRSWPEGIDVENENVKDSTVGVVYRFDSHSELMQTIARDAQMEILAHSKSLKGI